jgi:hypothetical protein
MSNLLGEGVGNVRISIHPSGALPSANQTEFYLYPRAYSVHVGAPRKFQVWPYRSRFRDKSLGYTLKHLVQPGIC